MGLLGKVAKVVTAPSKAVVGLGKKAAQTGAGLLAPALGTGTLPLNPDGTPATEPAKPGAGVDPGLVTAGAIVVGAALVLLALARKDGRRG